MIKFTITIDSYTLFRPVKVLVALPHSLIVKKPYRAIWALHPSMKGADIFFDDLGVARLMEEKNFAIIAPDLGNAFFVDSVIEKQASFLRAELVQIIRDNICISHDPQDNYLFGISSGGFGSLCWALSNGNIFSRVATMSSSILPKLQEDTLLSRKERFIWRLFSKQFKQIANFPANNLESLLESSVAKGEIPELAIFCGQEDNLCLGNIHYFHGLLQKQGLPVKLELSPGEHDIEYWHRTFPKAVEWLLAGGK